jgi:hypothetical protein
MAWKEIPIGHPRFGENSLAPINVTAFLIRFSAVAFAFASGVSAATEFPIYRQGAGASRPPLEVSDTLPSDVQGVAGGELDSLAF